jgi:uncharacterized protein
MRRMEITTGRARRGVIVESLILAVVALFLKQRGWTARRVGLNFSLKAALFGIVLFLAYIFWYWATALAVAVIAPSAANVRPFQFVITAAPAAMIAFIVVNSFFEEIIVTGYVINALSPQGAALSITASTLIRFLYHTYQGPLASISILPLGLLFGVVYWRWRNLWPMIVAHTIANLISFLLMSGR